MKPYGEKTLMIKSTFLEVQIGYRLAGTHIFQPELTQKSYSSATIVHTEIICSVYICAIHRHIIQVQSA